jgi:hypothetical protein
LTPFSDFSRSAINFFAHTRNTQKWAKKITAEQLKLENSVKTTKYLFYYLKIIQKFQILKKALKRAKT